jgi:hypothetical protein
MPQNQKLNRIIELSRALATQLNSDVRLSSTRVEHVRNTARANEANNILNELTALAGEINDEPEATD